MSMVALGIAVALILACLCVLGRGATVTPRFSAEYRARVSMQNPGWRRLRRFTFALTLGRDVVVPLLRAEQLDHLSYRRLGHEIPIWDVVPVSRGTHRLVTLLRRGGLKGPVNAVLRLSFVGWYTIAAYVGLLTLEALRVVHGIPTPQAIVTEVRVERHTLDSYLARASHARHE